MSKPSICTRVSRFRRRIREAIVPSVASLAVGLTLGASATPSNAATEAAGSRVRLYPACAQEDGQLCVWRNHGPGYSFVAGKDRNPGPREDIARYRISNTLADKLIARDNWQPVDRPGMPRDLVHPTRDGQTRLRINEHSVMSIGGTTYVITGRLVASS